MSTLNHIIKEIELFTALNSFVGAVKSLKLTKSSFSIRISSGGKFMLYFFIVTTYTTMLFLLENPLSNSVISKASLALVCPVNKCV